MKIRFTSGTDNAVLQEKVLMKKIEVAQMKKQIQILATFLPDEILQLRQSEMKETFSYVGVVLYAHVVGFTLLTEKYNKIGKGGIYRLTATLNAYIGALTEVVHFYGGDMLKFTGSTFVILWKVKPEESLYEILHEVVVCGMVVQQTLDFFETETNVELRIQLFMSCGNILFHVIGDEQSKDFILVGEALIECPIDVDPENVGVIVAPAAWAHMLQERYEVIPTYIPGYLRITKVFYKPNEAAKKRHFDEKHIEVIKLIELHLAHRATVNSKNRLIHNVAQSRLTEKFASQLPKRKQLKRAAKYWIIDNLRPFIIKPIQNQVDELQPVEYVTEVREVTIQRIVFDCNWGEDADMVKMINTAYDMISKVVTEMLGIISTTIVFGAVVSMVVLFGLRGRKHEMDSQNALRSASIIKTSLAETLGIKKMSASIAIGQVYCGVVGHPNRRQYVVVGIANRKAKMMMSIFPNMIVCDHKTFKNSKLSSFYFRLHHHNLGEEETGLIFEYNENFEEVPATVRRRYVIIGRHQEMNMLRVIIYEPEKFGFYSVCFQGPTKMGKTSIIHKAVQVWMKTRNFNIAAVELGAHSKIPYYCVRKLYRQLYDNLTVVEANNIAPILNLPRELLEPQNKHNPDDVAIYKYRILNYFRDICICTRDVTTIIFVDNVENIDLQSWEILEIVLSTKTIRLIMSATFAEETFDLKYEMSLNDLIKLIEVKPLQRNSLAAVACQFLEASGIPEKLVDLLEVSCEGRPGYVQSCLLRLINNGSIQLTLINSNDKDTVNYAFPEEIRIGEENSIIPIAVLSEKYVSNELTVAAISLDLFDSFTPWEQLVIKTGAVLGEIFPRYLMVIALKYPAETHLAQVVLKMFDEQVFECGSRFITSGDLEYNQPCCRCYFSREFFIGDKPYPTYAYCKLLHFRNKSIREVSYNLQPGNQKKELHLLCTNVLENMRVQCPRCTREPTTAFFSFGKFKDMLQFCDEPRALPKSTKCEYGDYENMRTTIKDFIAKDTQYQNKVTIKEYRRSKSTKQRPLFQPDLCNCLEMFVRNYMDLIYHSERAGHLGKRVYFTMQYGFILIAMFDILNGIRVLSEARELCMIDAKTATAQISDMFRKLHLGRIEIGLARAHINLRQLKTAKSHLAVSLRQYNIPLVSMTYKHFNKLITRSFLVNTPHTASKVCSNNMAKADLGTCLSLCSKVFAIEGNWELAKLTASYAIYLLRSTNCNIPVLYDTYCTAIDIYRYCNDTNTCLKLQKYITKELQLNYANDRTFKLYTLNNLLTNIFEIRCTSGNICAAIRLGYRVLDINFRVYSSCPNHSLISWLTILLTYNFRLKDCGDLCNMFVVSLNESLTYYKTCLRFNLYSGFVMNPFDDIIAFAKIYYKNKTRNLNWEDHEFHGLIQLYYLKHNQYQLAEEWNRPCNFDERNVRRDEVLLTLITIIDIRLILYLRMIRIEDPDKFIEERAIGKLLLLFKSQTDKNYKVFQPAYLVQKAYFERIKRNNITAYGLLNKAIKISEKQNNYLYKCLANKLRTYWQNGARSSFECQPNPHFQLAEGFSLTDWTNIMSTYAID